MYYSLCCYCPADLRLKFAYAKSKYSHDEAHIYDGCSDLSSVSSTMKYFLPLFINVTGLMIPTITEMTRASFLNNDPTFSLPSHSISV